MATRKITVRCIDLGLDDDADRFATFVAGVVVPFARSSGRVAPDIEMVRTRDLETLKLALAQPAHVVHLIGHIDATSDFVSLRDRGEHTALTVEELLAKAPTLRCAGLVVSAAKSGTRRFARLVRTAAATPLTFVGAPAALGWNDTTLFSAAFYAAYFSGSAPDKAASVLRAADRARNATRTATGRAAPLRGELITPTRSIRSS